MEKNSLTLYVLPLGCNRTAKLRYEWDGISGHTIKPIPELKFVVLTGFKTHIVRAKYIGIINKYSNSDIVLNDILNLSKVVLLRRGQKWDQNRFFAQSE